MASKLVRYTEVSNSEVVAVRRIEEVSDKLTVARLGAQHAPSTDVVMKGIFRKKPQRTSVTLH